MDVNNVTLTGRATKDVELKTTKSGKEVATISIAVNGRKDDPASFFNVTVFGKTAEVASKYVTKGKQIAVVGRLHQQRWEDGDGAKRYAVVVIANQLKLLGGGTAGPGEGNTQSKSDDVVIEDIDDKPIDLSEIPF